MSGRGDNNKSGSAGRGASNQSNQAFGQSENVRKSNHRKPTGGQRSVPDRKKEDASSNRDHSTNKEEK